MKTIEWRTCALEGCETQFIAKTWNNYYCSDEHAVEANRRNSRERMRQLRAKANQTFDAPANQTLKQRPPTALELYKNDLQLESFFLELQRRFSPYFLEVNNRLHIVDTKLDELSRALPMSPELAKKQPWRERAIRKIMQILIAYQNTPLGDYRNKHRLRERIEEAIQCNKYTAEHLMKAAEKRLQQATRDPKQGSMGDWI